MSCTAKSGDRDKKASKVIRIKSKSFEIYDRIDDRIYIDYKTGLTGTKGIKSYQNKKIL